MRAYPRREVLYRKTKLYDRPYLICILQRVSQTKLATFYVLGQPTAVRIDEVTAKRYDIVYRKLGGEVIKRPVLITLPPMRKGLSAKTVPGRVMITHR